MARYGVDKPDRTGFTTNLSKKGVFVHTNHVHKPGTALQLELVAGQRKVTLAAVVVWAKAVPAQLSHILPCGMGLRFTNPGPEWLEFFEVWSEGQSTIPRLKAGS